MDCNHWLMCEACGDSIPDIDSWPVFTAIKKRLDEIESKLGAASQRESTTREDVDSNLIGDSKSVHLSQAAAPNASIEEWCIWAEEDRNNGNVISARAFDLAAAVTKACEKELDVNWLCRITLSFVRGKQLPNKEV